MIDKFKQGISLQDGSYYVELPWKDEVISKVPSNHKVALSVLDKVVKDHDKRELLSSHQACLVSSWLMILLKKLMFILMITTNSFAFCIILWLRHTNTTTKISPIFNCSLKTNKAPSLNEAENAGVNLMKDIVKLSIYFRSNKYTMLSDIKHHSGK